MLAPVLADVEGGPDTPTECVYPGQVERIVNCPNGTRLCIDEVGDPEGPLVVQLEGHMAQLISTPQSFCERLAERGLHVVRVDNRDVGRSSRFPGRDYTLRDMADDVHGLLGQLGGPAVVCGRSMGGAIAQLLAIHHPEDVSGLGLFFTFATESASPEPAPVGPAPFDDAASFLTWERQSLPGIAGSHHPFTDDEIASLAREMWERGVDWAGFERQRRAMGLEGPWAAQLAEVGVPTVIVHGAEDPVVPVTAGRRLAELIPHAELHIVDGMGHQQPPALDDLFVGATLSVVPGH